MKSTKSILALAAFAAVTLWTACGKKNDSDPNNNPGSKGGKITLNYNGKTKTFTNKVNAVIFNGKFQGCTNSDEAIAKIGDGEDMNTAAGTTKSGTSIVFTIGDITSGDSGESCSITITSYDGSTIKGTFKGELDLDQNTATDRTPVTGTFETNDITNI